ncbi:ABC transporter oskyddad [Arctopsyche grandis]|uniref:ABC transporter oskyddad n=1 Tax=Arctopsyche grandis TaxID=121162 RepID=UPI00406D7999
MEPEISSEAPAEARRRILMTQKSTIASRKRQAVCVRRAHKNYGPKKNPNVILDGLNMTVPKGSIYGLLGASGCGKTTLLSCIVGRRRLNSGEIWVLGGTPGSRGSGVPGPRIGYMPQEVALFSEFTIRETLIYFGWVSGMTTEQVNEKIDFLIKLLQLPSASRNVKNLSGGQARRVSLAAALVHSPELLILDEPTVGVDPILRQCIWDHLVDITKEGKTTVIITTHYIDETRQAHLIGLMRGGRFLAEESPNSLMERYAAESLEEVFLKLAVMQNKGKRRRSSIVQEISESIQVPAITDPAAIDLEEAEIGEISGEFGDNVSMSSKGRVVVTPELVPPTEAVPPEEEPPGGCMDRYKPMQMNHMKALVWKNLLAILRNVGIMLFIIGLPVSQIVLFCVTIGHDPIGLNIAIVNYELPPSEMLKPCKLNITDCTSTLWSCKYLNFLDERKGNLVPYLSREEAMTAARKGNTWAVVVFPHNFSRALESRLELLRDAEEDVIDASIVEVHMDVSNKQIEFLLLRDFTQSFSNFAKALAVSCGYSEKAYDVPVRFNDPIYGERVSDFTDFAGPGVILTVIFFLAVALTSVAMLIERNEGVLERSLVSGITGTEILFSHVITQFIVMCVQTLLVLLFAFAVFGLTCRGDMFWVVVLTLITGLCGMTFGFVVSCICDTERTATFLAMGSFLPMIMLCGIIWPIEGMNHILQYISYLLPLTKSTESLRSILQRGWGMSVPDVYLGFVSTFIWIIIYLTTSILLIKFKKG